MWAIYRGPQTAVKAAGHDQAAGPTTHAITWPTPGAGAVGQVLFSHQQNSATPTPPAGYVARVAAYPHSVFRMTVMENTDPPSAGAVTISAISAAVPHYINAIELRL